MKLYKNFRMLLKRFEITFFLFQYMILCNQYYYVITNPMFGNNVRLAKDNEFPFSVCIVRIDNEKFIVEENFVCTGVLVTKQDVLTLAHCLEEEDLHKMEVYAGSNDIMKSTRYLPLWWITFNEWAASVNIQPQHRVNDIANIKLCKNVTHAFIPPSLSTFKNQELFGQDITIASWGLDKEDVLCPLMKTVVLKVLSIADCRNRVSRLHGSKVKIHERHICSHADPPAIMYFGDSGGPVLYKDKLIGLHKATIPFPEDARDLRKINIHTSIYFYRNFILAVIDPNFVYN